MHASRLTAVAQFAPTTRCENLLERLLVRNLFANGGHLLIRRAAIDIAGGFRHDLSYGEDWEYWTRLALLGRFVPAAAGDPVLFVRERPGSAYLRMATDPACFATATDAIYGNPEIMRRFGAPRLRTLRRRAEAETAWVIGRELIRHGRLCDGWRWLGTVAAGGAAAKAHRIGGAVVGGDRAFPAIFGFDGGRDMQGRADFARWCSSMKPGAYRRLRNDVTYLSGL